MQSNLIPWYRIKWTFTDHELTERKLTECPWYFPLFVKFARMGWTWALRINPWEPQKEVKIRALKYNPGPPRCLRIPKEVARFFRPYGTAERDKPSVQKAAFPQKLSFLCIPWYNPPFHYLPLPAGHGLFLSIWKTHEINRSDCSITEEHAEELCSGIV